MIANSYKMIRVKETAAHIGSLDATAIILGESGAGKEMVAELIYESSQRIDEPFIKVNCAAIPDNLMESILFGSSKGSFTGTKEELLQEQRAVARKECLKKPTAERYFWMKSESFLCLCSRSCFAYSRTEK